MEAPVLAPGKRPMHAGRRDAVTDASPGKLALTQRLPSAVIARDASGPAPDRLPQALRSALAGESGTPLPEAVNWSRQLGADVSAARVVTGPRAEAAADSISARAFTVGDRIFFGTGQSPSGSLLEHELTHVAQQRGAAMPAIDDLRITSPDEAMEQEAQVGAPGQQSSTAVIARDTLTTSEYLDRHRERLGSAVGGRLAGLTDSLAPRLSSPYATWTSGPGAIVEKVRTAVETSTDATTTLRPLLAPSALEYYVDRGRRVSGTLHDRVSVGSDDWSDDVAIAIADGLARSIGDAIARIVPRYLAARSAAQQRAWAAARECDPATEPEAQRGDIVSSHPIDRFLIDALCAGGMLHIDLPRWRTDNPALADATTAGVLRPGVRAPIVAYARPTGGGSLGLAGSSARGGPGWIWVRSDPADATAEEVAQTLFGGPDQAYRLAVKTPPLFSFHSDQVWNLSETLQAPLLAQSPDLRAEQEHRRIMDGIDHGWVGGALPRDPVREAWTDGDHERELGPVAGDPTAGLSGPLADEAALAASRATGAPAAGPAAAARGRDVILGQMGENKVLLQSILALGTTFEAAEFTFFSGFRAALQSVITRIDDRRDRLRAAPDSDVQQWDGHTRQQAQVLGGALSGLTSASARAQQMHESAGRTGAVDVSAMSRAARAPLQRVATEYVGAAAAAELPAAARDRLTAADAAAQIFPAEMMELILQELQRTLAGVTNRSTYDADRLAATEVRLRGEIAQLRQLILGNSPEAATVMQRIWAEVQDLQTETVMIANLDGLNSAFEGLGELADSFGVWGDADTRLRNLQAEVPTWQGRWRTIYNDWQAATTTCGPDTEARKAEIRTRFDALRSDPALADFLSRMHSAVEDGNQRHLIASLIALLAIVVITMGAGLAVEAFVGGTAVAGGAVGLGWSASATMAAVVVTEAAVFTALHTAVFVNHPTLSGVLVEFGYNLILFRALRGVSAAVRGSGRLGTFLAETGTTGAGELLGQGLVLGSFTLARAEVETLLRQGRHLTSEEATRITVESTATFIAMVILARVARPMLEPLEGAAGRLGESIRAANEARSALADAAREVQASKDMVAARALLRMDAESLLRDRVALEELQRCATETPEVLRARGLTDPEIAQLAREVGANVMRIRIAELMQGVENVGGDTYAMPRDNVPEHLMRHQALGGRVTQEGVDAITGMRTFRVEYPEGTNLRVFERPGPARPGADGTVPSADVVAANRAAADAAAEVQARRDGQATALYDSGSGGLRMHTAIFGAGTGGTLAHASLPAGSGRAAAPGIDITELPLVANFAAEGSMFARHGDFPIGQGPAELASPAMTRQPGEFTGDHSRPVTAADYVRALTMTGYETGMVTIRHNGGRVESNPRDGTWEFDTPLRFEAGGRWVYVNNIVSATGLGAPRPVGIAGEAALVAAGRMVYAQETLTLPSGAQVVLVIGGGATGIWACEASLRAGATRVLWSGRPPRPGSTVDVPADVRARLERLGMTEEQIQTFYTAHNARNAATFGEVGGRIELTTARLEEATIRDGRVVLRTGTGEIVVDGVVAATGQVVTLPEGMADVRFRLVVVEYNGAPRLVGLDAVDAGGNLTGYRMLGAQIMNRGMADLVVPAEQARYMELVDALANDPSVPRDSRGVPGSIYQSNISTPLAESVPLPVAPRPPPTPVGHPPHDDRRPEGTY